MQDRNTEIIYSLQIFSRSFAGFTGLRFNTVPGCSVLMGSVDGAMPGDDRRSRAPSAPGSTKTVTIATASEGPTIFCSLTFTIVYYCCCSHCVVDDSVVAVLLTIITIERQ